MVNEMNKHYYPKFVWTKPCKNCPSRLPADPETLDYLKLNLFRRMRSAFACAWRPKGYCKNYYKKMVTGKDFCDPGFENFDWSLD